MTQRFDVVIAGGGMAGCLTAARIAAARPGISIAVLEKESAIGGRARSARPGSRGYGLHRVTPALFEFIAQSLKANPEAPDLHDMAPRREDRMGILAGSEIAAFDATDFFGPPGAKAVAGMVGLREWRDNESFFTRLGQEETADQALGQVWPLSRKGGASAALECWAGYLGVPDAWHASSAAVGNRAALTRSRYHVADWTAVLESLMTHAGQSTRVEMMTGCSVLSAAKTDDGWKLRVEKGEIDAGALVVAMPPWPAIGWLPKPVWPQAPLYLTMRMRPVTAVVLSENLALPELDVPDAFFVPAEGTQVMVNREAREVVFQATLDYEMSLQAPNVVKAVRALKRSRKRLNQLHPGAVSENDHLAIVPVAWPQSPAQSDRKTLERMGKSDFQDARLAFCGDAYGASYDGDENLIRSVVDACAAVVSGARGAGGAS